MERERKKEESERYRCLIQTGVASFLGLPTYVCVTWQDLCACGQLKAIYMCDDPAAGRPGNDATTRVYACNTTLEEQVMYIGK